MAILSDAENRTIVSSFVWTQYRNVTEGRTDGIPLAITVLCIASCKNYNRNINVIVIGVVACSKCGRYQWRLFVHC